MNLQYSLGLLENWEAAKQLWNADAYHEGYLLEKDLLGCHNWATFLQFCLNGHLGGPQSSGSLLTSVSGK